VPAVVATALGVLAACDTSNADRPGAVKATAAGETPATATAPKVTKTDAEWRQLLDEKEYAILVRGDTERAFTGAYWDNHEKGVYVCAASGVPLFSSADKFDSGTGWPSFTRPIDAANVLEVTDSSLGMQRVEVRDAATGFHLGHVFDDGPEPTGKRYCINSAALRFVPAGK
jgi:methionine-R-sulfoxide reductase